MPPSKAKTDQDREKALKRILAIEAADLTKTMTGLSFGLMGVFIFLAFLDYIESVNLPLEQIDYIIFAILGLLGPIGFYMSTKEKRIREIETRLTDFLRDVAAAGRF